MDRQHRRVALAAGLRQHQLQVAVRCIRRQLEVHLVQTHQRRRQAGERHRNYSFPFNVSVGGSVGRASGFPGDGCPLATGLSVNPIPDT